MSVPSRLAGAVGEWTGNNKLWFDSTKPAIESETMAVVQEEAAGRMIAVRYSWGYEGKAREGILLLGDDPATGRCDAAWSDSFHNGHRLMPLTGPLAGDDNPTVTGSYPAPSGPPWGWRITLEHPSPNAFVMRMHNITPDGKAELAVEASYARR